MLVTSTAYWIGIGVLCVLIFGVSFWMEKTLEKHKEEKKRVSRAIGILLIIALAITNKWIFPNVYTVPSCGTVVKEVLLLPAKTPDGLAMGYGKHCYLINTSSSTLGVETVFYGSYNSTNQRDKVIDTTVVADSSAALNTVSLDDFFETSPATVDSKADGVIRYAVGCLDEEYPEEQTAE